MEVKQQQQHDHSLTPYHINVTGAETASQQQEQELTAASKSSAVPAILHPSACVQIEFAGGAARGRRRTYEVTQAKLCYALRRLQTLLCFHRLLGSLRHRNVRAQREFGACFLAMHASFMEPHHDLIVLTKAKVGFHVLMFFF